MSWQDFEDQEYEDQESQDEEYESGESGGGGNRNSNTGLIILLLIIALIVALASMGHGGGGGSSSTGGGTTFNAGQQAFQLAQDTQSFRSANSYGGNYGKVSIVTVNSDGTINQVYTTDPFQGHNPASQHSEPLAINWAVQQLGSLQQQGALKGLSVHVVLFTQVRACTTCSQLGATWAQQLDAAAGQHVAFSYWEIAYGSPSGFSPADYPQGPDTPGGQHGRYPKPVSVRQQDLNEIYARP